MSKKKANSNQKKGKTKGGDDDDDWEAILNAEKATNEALAPPPPPPPAASVNPPPQGKSAVKNESKPAAGQGNEAAEGKEEKDDDDSEDDEEEEGGKKDKDKKKKKKKGKKEKEEAKKATSAPQSAQAKAILLHKQRLAEEEARLKKLQEEEEQRIKEEEDRIEAERKRIAEEKERKRKAKQEKVEAQKAAGTYMTKSEKEKARKAQERLDALKAANLLVIPPTATSSSASTQEGVSAAGAAALYGRKKPKKPLVPIVVSSEKEEEEEEEDEEASDSEDSTDEEEEEAVAEKPSVAAVEPVASDGPLVDDWDADGDDWESNLDKISQKVETLKVTLDNDVEDLIELEKRNEQEKLRQQGIDRMRREEEMRIKREAEDREREEMERKAFEAILKKEAAKKARLEREESARKARSASNLRSPISCIMGHVDTGKTKLLDKIRHTNVQEGEAGGITQQIGATQFSKETLLHQTACLQDSAPFSINIPGLLVIDTPGHESFTNLRSRGSSLCDIAILVIDLMHGLEQQTLESLNLLKKKKTPFIVALNKVDRCYGWKTLKDGPIQKALAMQDENTRYEFKDRSERVIVQLMEQGLNAKLYWENDDLAHTVSLVPTSAISGEGVPDLLRMLITLTQDRLTEQLMYMDILQCTVLEVKVIEGLGHTVDVILVNGVLNEGDTIVVSTMDGPIVTNIRALLTPPPNREMRVRSEYIHHQSIHGATGVKIVAPDIGRAIAGTSILVVNSEYDDVDDIKEEVQSDLTKVMKGLQTDQKGVMVHASTLGALEALLQFLREECKPSIPVTHVNIGPIHKKDVMRASIMHEKKLPEFATILAFDVPIDAEAREMAEESKVKIFTAEIIYHLFDQFTAYMNGLYEAKKSEAQAVVVFPCVLKILPQHIFNKKDPIVLGVEVMEGTLRLNTPLCIPQLSMLDVGSVTRLEINHKEVTSAKKGTQLSIRIANEHNSTITYGRQFDHTSNLYSKISRGSIDACKDYFKDDMTKDDWNLVIKLKKLFNIS